MQYIVLDLEWNQALSPDDPIYQKLPFHLHGEIIQIGAVRLDSHRKLQDTWKTEVKPVWFRKMHTAVQKLTGITEQQLSLGMSFPQAITQFRSWCGEDKNTIFLTWGFDDVRMLKQNLMLYGLEDSWIDQWYNLQLIYNQQTHGGSNQKGLLTAAEEMGIAFNRPAHDALNDAYYTACIASKLDLETGIAQYSKKAILRKTHSASFSPPILIRKEFDGYRSKSQILNDKKLQIPHCPRCGKPMESEPMVSQNGNKYIYLAHCQKHGTYFVRIKIEHKSEPAVSWKAIQLIFSATSDYKELYQRKRKRAKQRKINLKPKK